MTTGSNGVVEVECLIAEFLPELEALGIVRVAANSASSRASCWLILAHSTSLPAASNGFFRVAILYADGTGRHGSFAGLELECANNDPRIRL